MLNSVKVGVKLRPLIKPEKDDNLSIQWIVQDNSILSLSPDAKKWGDNNGFRFDYIFDTNATNSNVFDSIIKPIVDAAIDGFNGTVFCYGQFHSGKTYTMIGTSEEPGIMPLVIEYIFNIISTAVKREFLLRVSYLEICDQKINDLLNKNGVDLKLYKDENGQAIINCKEEIINSSGNMLSIMEKGIKNKRLLEIKRNKFISSHSIFRIIIESQEVEGDSNNAVQVSQLNLIDLAGFKKVHCTNALEVEQLFDTSSLTLESFIMQQTKSQNVQEDSDHYSNKLTELLQPSLNGNALTAIICTVTPVALEETYYTLLCASQAKTIKIKPEKNEVMSDSPLLIRYAKQLTKLQTELERIRTGNSSVESEEVRSNNLQKKYHINRLLEERIKLLKTQIISGYTKNGEESFKYKSRRRQIWYNPGTFSHYLPISHTKICLPTIKEISPEKPYKKKIMQSVNVINQTFETAFTDFELELIDCEGHYDTKDSNTILCSENEYNVGLKNDNFYLTPEKQDSSVQTSSNQASPSTPKSVLRRYIFDLTKDLTELREFTTLEKQLMCESHCCTPNLEEQIADDFTCSCLKNDEINDCSTNLIIKLEDEKTKLEEDLELKVKEINEIKNGIQSLKIDIEKLQKTIYLLTNENVEMSTKLLAEKERSKQIELNLQTSIDELYVRISKITDEKIKLESDLRVLNDQLESLRAKTQEECNDEQLIIKYQNEIDTLKTENIELSAIIAEKNKELESVKECKSLLYDHECIYKDKITSLAEKNESLVAENNELSTDLIDKIEENDMLKEQCDILKNKVSSMENTSSDENDVELLRTENSILRAEIVELKMKVTMLSEENTKFSNNLLETMEEIDNSRNNELSIKTLHMSAVPDNNIKITEITKEPVQKENYEEMANKVITLQDQVNHLSHLNKKLSELKLSSCSQCAHLKNLNESRRALKLEAKSLNHKLEDLQKKFDRKCADTEALKLKVNQELNLSFGDSSFNASFADGMNVSFVEEKVQYLNNELQVLKDDRDKLSVLYLEKCNELEKFHDEVVDAKNTDNDCKPKKLGLKTETRIEQIQKSIDQVKDDIDELKKNSTNFTSVLSKFRTEKRRLLDEINMLKSINEELQQKVSDKEITEKAVTEKAQILENEIQIMSKEIEQFTVKEKIICSEKLTLEVELEDLKVEKKTKDILIVGLHQTIDDLNGCISSLKNELDSITNEKNELITLTETTERKYTDELEQLKKQYDEVEREKQESIEAEKRTTVWARELESDVNRLQTDLTKQENLYKELQRNVSQLESLLQDSEKEKEVLKEKLQVLEVQLIDSKDNLVIKYKNEFETIRRRFEEYTKESEIKLNKINETLNKYVEENDSLTQQLLKFQDIELKFKNLHDKNEFMYNAEKPLMTDNKKLREELDIVKECMMKELKSLKYKVNSVDFLNKTTDEMFIIFLQTLMSKEKEVIDTMRELFETDKQKLEDEIQQKADSEKRVTLWAKELETEIEKLQMDLTNKENLCAKQQDKLYQLEHLLRENSYEKEMLKEKIEALEVDFSNLQSEFDKQSNIDIQQKEVQKRKKETQEALISKENEIQSKIKSEIEVYEKKIDELLCTIEVYKTKNMELKSNVEGLEANEKQLKNIIEANSSELKMNNQTIEKMTRDFKQLTGAFNDINRGLEQKTSQIENIKALLKNKCDMLSEYKAKLETITPDYEILQNQVKEKKESVARCKEEIEKLKMDKEKQIEVIKDQLNSEEIKNVGLNKQLNELNNKNLILVEELDNLKEQCEELQQANAKLERKIRNSTSKMKAEAEMEELMDVNKSLQNNLEGASNRITELQNSKNNILKELVNLKGQYELLSQENVEIKKSLSLCKSKQRIPCLSEGNSKYDTLLQEKNKIALELEGKKLLLIQKDKEIKEYTNKIKDLTIGKKELDAKLKECTALLCQRDMEISSFKFKLHVHQTENKVINELEKELKVLDKENNIKDQLRPFKTEAQINGKQIEDKKWYNEKICYLSKRENSEVQKKINEYENKRELKSNSSGSRCTSPALENNRRRHSRNEIFNQRRQLENVIFDTDINENEETCQVLRKRIQELELQLVSKNGQIAALEMQIESENFPYQEKCKDLEELILTLREKNSELTSEVRELQRTLNDINAWECDTCRRWRINKRNKACQATSNNTSGLNNLNNGIINDIVKVTKVEKEKAIMKGICRSQCRQIKYLEDKVRELEAQATSSAKCIDILQEKSNQYRTTTHSNKKFDLQKNTIPAMKENVAANVLLTKSSNYKRSVWNKY
ncbi:Centromere-associated protein E [Anthophora retusa]